MTGDFMMSLTVVVLVLPLLFFLLGRVLWYRWRMPFGLACAIAGLLWAVVGLRIGRWESFEASLLPAGMASIALGIALVAAQRRRDRGARAGGLPWVLFVAGLVLAITLHFVFIAARFWR